MGIFTWNDGYLLGVPIIDSEHKTLFAIADELNESIIHGDNTRTQKNLLTRLINAFITHFEHEEGLMSHYQYPDLEDHADEHRTLSAQMIKLKQRLDAGALTIPMDAMQTLRNWFDRHIRRYDQLVVRHIRQNDMIGLRA
ncbi:MAG: bacteriohemerythrin [Bryobacteraceae bacterium]|jgi:hemerythrin-like metal-binding protein